jgi:CheY-like chemotaxis protein
MSQKKVVVIDDCVLHLQMVRDILEPAGYEVLTADSSIAANAYIYTTPPPDLLLVDVEMPMLNGAEKVRLLKQREKSREIPTLLISAKAPEEMAALARESGAEGFLCKPFEKESLISAISEYL